MHIVSERCAGLDVHKRTVVACVVMTQNQGIVQRHVQTFGTMTADLLALGDWLRSHEVTHVAMESTGVFWKPVWNLLYEIIVIYPCIICDWVAAHMPTLSFMPHDTRTVQDNLILEAAFTLLLVNPQQIKAVPGRKTDVKDSEWIADLLRHGLLSASFVPPALARTLRELTRYRTTLVQQRAQEVLRVQKVLEGS